MSQALCHSDTDPKEGFGEGESLVLAGGRASAGMLTRAMRARLRATTDFSGFSLRKEVPLNSENTQ